LYFARCQRENRAEPEAFIVSYMLLIVSVYHQAIIIIIII